MIDKTEAIAKVEDEINQPDLDWPTKQRHAVYDGLTIDRPWGWVLFYAVHEDFWVAHRDRNPDENPPYFVSRSDGALHKSAGRDLQAELEEFERSMG